MGAERRCRSGCITGFFMPLAMEYGLMDSVNVPANGNSFFLYKIGHCTALHICAVQLLLLFSHGCASWMVQVPLQQVSNFLKDGL